MHYLRDPQAEQRLQHSFSKSSIFNGLALAGLVVGAHLWLTGLPDRSPAPDARGEVRFEPVQLAKQDFAPLIVAGAWRVTSPDPRVGGVSALAVDRGGLLALTDSGVTIRLPKPVAASGIAEFRDLPSGPGQADQKSGRDSEALTRDSAGRGWWVTFEHFHSAWLFDRDLRRVIRTVDLRALGWRSNLGAEGAVSTGDGLLLFPESGEETVRVGDSRIARASLAKRTGLANTFGHFSDAAMLPDGRIVVVARSYSPAGFSSRLLMFDKGQLRPLAKLALGRLDNAEAIAAEPLAGGGTRLWVMTDNDFRRRVPTLLIALDWAHRDSLAGRSAPPVKVRPRRPAPFSKSRA